MPPENISSAGIGIKIVWSPTEINTQIGEIQKYLNGKHLDIKINLSQEAIRGLEQIGKSAQKSASEIAKLNGSLGAGNTLRIIADTSGLDKVVEKFTSINGKAANISTRTKQWTDDLGQTVARVDHFKDGIADAVRSTQSITTNLKATRNEAEKLANASRNAQTASNDMARKLIVDEENNRIKITTETQRKIEQNILGSNNTIAEQQKRMNSVNADSYEKMWLKALHGVEAEQLKLANSVRNSYSAQTFENFNKSIGIGTTSSNSARDSAGVFQAQQQASDTARRMIVDQENQRVAITTNAQRRIEQMVLRSNEIIEQQQTRMNASQANGTRYEQMFLQATRERETLDVRNLETERLQTTELQRQVQLYQQSTALALRNIQSQYGSLARTPAIQGQLGNIQSTVGGLNSNTLDATGFRNQSAQINASIASVRASLNEAKLASNSFGNDLIKNFGKMMSWSLIATAIYAPIRAISSGIEYIHQMDDALTDLSKVVNFSAKELDEMAVSAINLGKELGKSSVEIMKGMAEFGRVAKNQKDIIELTRVASMTSNVTTMSAQEAAKNITSSMITFGIEAKDSMKILNSWNEIQNNFRVNAEDLASSIGKIGAASKVAKVEMADLEGMTTAIVQSTGITGNEAGTAIKSFMSRIYRTDMSDPEELGKTAKALKSIVDIDVKDTNGDLKGFNDLINEIATSWVTMSQQEKIAVSQSLGSTYHYSKFVALMENYSTKIDAATMARNSENSALDENAKVLDSISGRMGLLKVASEEFWASMINSGTVKSTISALTYLVSTFANLGTILSVVGIGLLAFKGTALIGFFSALTLSTNIFNYSLVQTGARLAGLSFAEIGAMSTTIGLSASIKGLGFALRGLASSIGPIGLIVGALSLVTIGMDIYNQKQEENAIASEQASQKLNQEQEALSGLSDEYRNIITSGNLTSESKARLKGIQNELIKTYGIEADSLDLVNGKYKDQIDLIDKIVADKAKEQLASMGTSGEEALAKSTRVSSSQFSGGDTRGSRSKVDSIFESIVGSSIGESTRGKALFEINGTLENRVSILKKLKLELDEVANKDKFTTSIINEVTAEYNKLNGELKANQTILDKYVQNKNVSDFYDEYKTQISEVKDLIAQSEKKPTDTGISKQLIDLKSKMEDVAESKGRLGDFQSFINEIFGKPPTDLNDALTQASGSLLTTGQAFSDMAKSTEASRETIKSYNQILYDKSKGEIMSVETAYDLIKTNDKLAGAFTIVNGSVVINEEAVKKLRLAEIDLANTQVTASNTGIGAQINSAKAAIVATQSRIDTINDEISALSMLNIARVNVSANQEAQDEKAYTRKVNLLNLQKASQTGYKSDLDKLYGLQKSFMDGVSSSSYGVSETKDKKDPKSSLSEQVDIEQSLVKSFSTEANIVGEANKLLEKQIKNAEQQKNYNDQLDKTNQLIAGQSNQISLLGTAKNKIEAEFAKVSSQSGFSNTSQFVDTQGEATLYYQNLWNASSVATQKNLSATFDKLSTLRKAWVENKKAVDDLTASQISLFKSMQDINTEIADDAINTLKKAFELQKDIDIAYIQSRMDAEDKRHNKVISNLDAEIKKLEDQENANDYAKNLTKSQQEIRDIQNEITIRSKDDSIESKAKVEELQKQLTEKTTSLQDSQHKHEIDLKKQSLQNQKEVENSKYNTLKDQLEKEKKTREYYWNEQLNNEQYFANMRQNIINGNVDGIKAKMAGFLSDFKNMNEQTAQQLGISWANVKNTIGAIGTTNGALGNVSTNFKPTVTATGADADILRKQYGDSIIIVSSGGIVPNLAGSSGSDRTDTNKLYQSVLGTPKNNVSNADMWKYAEGGQTEKTGVHWLDGKVGRPERVLSPEQTMSFNRLVDMLPKINLMSNFNFKAPQFTPNLASVNSGTNINLQLDFHNFGGTKQDSINISQTLVNTLKRVGVNIN